MDDNIFLPDRFSLSIPTSFFQKYISPTKHSQKKFHIWNVNSLMVTMERRASFYDALYAQTASVQAKSFLLRNRSHLLREVLGKFQVHKSFCGKIA